VLNLNGNHNILNIIICAQIFETHEDNGSDRCLFFAKDLVKRGNKVKIITSNFDYKLGRNRFTEKRKFAKNIDGIDVVYVPVYSKIRGNYFKRFMFYVSFMFSCLKELIMSARNADVILSISTPLTVPFICAIVSKITKTPLVTEITDVWPDAAIHTGVISNRLIIFLAKKVEKFCYKNSISIICLTEGIQKNILDKGTPIEKTVLITNGVDINLFNNSAYQSKSTLKNSLGLENKFVAMYLGAHGKYNSLDTIIEAAILLRNERSIVFVFVGDGEQKSHLQELVAKESLNNVIFYQPVKRKDSPEFLSIANCFLLPNLKGNFFKGNLPNKVFDYLASRRPIIVSGRVESATLVEKIEAGFVVDAENPSQLANKIKMTTELTDNEREIIGNKGHDYVKTNFNRALHADKILLTLERAICSD
jgi:glycosyltransferase involved in cell wall biosynthesis